MAAIEPKNSFLPLAATAEAPRIALTFFSSWSAARVPKPDDSDSERRPGLLVASQTSVRFTGTTFWAVTGVCESAQCNWVAPPHQISEQIS